jgi:copper(I)-binding protein
MRSFTKALIASGLTLAALLGSADAHEIKAGDLVIDHPWARQSPKGAQVAAGYMTIINNGKQDDRLIKATAEISATAQIHDMKMEGDVMKMTEMAEGIVIPAGGSVVLKPKSLHIMFLGLKTPVEEGQVFAGTLTFEKAGTVDIEYEVSGMTATTP